MARMRTSRSRSLVRAWSRESRVERSSSFHVTQLYTSLYTSLLLLPHHAAPEGTAQYLRSTLRFCQAKIARPYFVTELRVPSGGSGSALARAAKRERAKAVRSANGRGEVLSAKAEGGLWGVGAGNWGEDVTHATTVTTITTTTTTTTTTTIEILAPGRLGATSGSQKDYFSPATTEAFGISSVDEAARLYGRELPGSLLLPDENGHWDVSGGIDFCSYKYDATAAIRAIRDEKKKNGNGVGGGVGDKGNGAMGGSSGGGNGSNGNGSGKSKGGKRNGDGSSAERLVGSSRRGHIGAAARDAAAAVAAAALEDAPGPAARYWATGEFWSRAGRDETRAALKSAKLNLNSPLDSLCARGASGSSGKDARRSVWRGNGGRRGKGKGKGDQGDGRLYPHLSLPRVRRRRGQGRESKARVDSVLWIFFARARGEGEVGLL